VGGDTECGRERMRGIDDDFMPSEREKGNGEGGSDSWACGGVAGGGGSSR
jgi:hypothetical protein